MDNPHTYYFEDLLFLKYHNGLEWESRLTLRLNAATTTDYIKKYFKQKLSRIKYPTKNLLDAYLYLPPWAELGGSEIYYFWNTYGIIMRQNGNADLWASTTVVPKVIHDIFLIIKENMYSHENFYVQYFRITLFLNIVTKAIKIVVALRQFFIVKSIEGSRVFHEKSVALFLVFQWQTAS